MYISHHNVKVKFDARFALNTKQSELRGLLSITRMPSSVSLDFECQGIGNQREKVFDVKSTKL